MPPEKWYEAWYNRGMMLTRVKLKVGSYSTSASSQRGIPIPVEGIPFSISVLSHILCRDGAQSNNVSSLGLYSTRPLAHPIRHVVFISQGSWNLTRNPTSHC